MMWIALESGNTTNHGIDRSGCVHGLSCMAIYNSPDTSRFSAGDRMNRQTNKAALECVVEEGENDDSCSDSSSSSIGRNSDDDSSTRRSSDGGDGEVQSEFKSAPLDNMGALEEVLPFRRSISNFYGGKSKSFTSLADAASCSSIKEIVKPENAYTRKRKNLLDCSNFCDKNYNFPFRRSNNGGLSKRFANSSRRASALTDAMNNLESNNYSESSNLKSSSSNWCLPPLPPHARTTSNNESSSSRPWQNFCSWRSFSLSDLQCAASTAPRISNQ